VGLGRDVWQHKCGTCGYFYPLVKFWLSDIYWKCHYCDMTMRTNSYRAVFKDHSMKCSKLPVPLEFWQDFVCRCFSCIQIQPQTSE
jgi:hypothetical protein